MKRNLRNILTAALVCLLISAVSVADAQIDTQSDAGSLLADPVQAIESSLESFDRGQKILGTQPDKARELFLKAARGMESVASSGVRNGKLEYNIGNCYLQAGKIGEAILHYRRAERYIPGDPLLEDNLREARSRRLTTITPKSGTSLLRGIFFLHFATSSSTRLTIAIVSYLAFWVVLTIRAFVKSRAINVLAVVCFAVLCSLGVSLAINRWEDRNAPEGVVLGMDVAVYNGPGVSYQRRFEQPLQPGVEFTRRARRGNWWKIELPDGNSGWIGAESANLVPR